jgi:hypothetical protein
MVFSCLSKWVDGFGASAPIRHALFRRGTPAGDYRPHIRIGYDDRAVAL